MIRKIMPLIVSILLLSGCSTYKFHRGQAPYNKGYIVSRDNYTILEYTIGKNNSVPNLQLARERFKERKGTVEHYYKRMGYIEDKIKMTFWDPPVLFLKFLGGIFRLPSIVISDYKYEHNPEYRKKFIKMQEDKEAKEEARIQELKQELNSYLEQELAKEKT